MTIKLKFPYKGPYEILDYTFDWRKVLRSDQVDTSIWSVLPAGVVVTENGFTNTTTTAILADGTANTTYQVQNTITTTGGKTYTRTANLLVDVK